MKPDAWGRYGWGFLHAITLNYPEQPTPEDKANHYQFMQDVQKVLPCNNCSGNMVEHLKKLPLTDEILSNRQSFIMWMIDLHNLVNYHTGKKVLSHAEALEAIKRMYEPKKSVWGTIVVIILLILILALFYYL